MAGIAIAGWALAVQVDLRISADSTGYITIATALLVIGLYSSAHGIALGELRVNVSTVVLAVTVGVFVKAALIAGAMYLFYRDPAYAVLGLAVAQIDPLAVAALNRRSRMSDQAKTLLAAWASFDDPITVILTVYGTAWLIDRGAVGGEIGDIGASAGSFQVGLAQNLLLGLVALTGWAVVRTYRRRRERMADGGGSNGITVLEVALLFAFLCVGIAYSLALGVALVGLFLRPRLGAWLARATDGALLAACFMLGLTLAAGIDVSAGVLLGACAFAAQMVVGLVIPARVSGLDRAYLAAGQQNGITAIILALLLESAFSGTVAIVAPAILTVALLHGVANGILDSRQHLVGRGGGPPLRVASKPGTPAVDETDQSMSERPGEAAFIAVARRDEVGGARRWLAAAREATIQRERG